MAVLHLQLLFMQHHHFLLLLLENMCLLIRIIGEEVVLQRAPKMYQTLFVLNMRNRIVLLLLGGYNRGYGIHIA